MTSWMPFFLAPLLLNKMNMSGVREKRKSRSIQQGRIVIIFFFVIITKYLLLSFAVYLSVFGVPCVSFYYYQDTVLLLTNGGVA